MVPLGAAATLSRLTAVGGAGSAEPGNGWALPDATGVFLFGTRLLDHGNLISLELGTAPYTLAYDPGRNWGWASLSGTLGGHAVAAGLSLRRPESEFGRTIWGLTGWEDPYYAEDALVRDVVAAEPVAGVVVALALGAGQRVALHADYAATRNRSQGAGQNGAGFALTTDDLHQSTGSGIALSYGYVATEILRSIDASVHLRARAFENKRTVFDWAGPTSYWQNELSNRGTAGSESGGLARAEFAVGENLLATFLAGYVTARMDWSYDNSRTWVNDTTGASIPPLLAFQHVVTPRATSSQTDAGTALRWNLAHATVFGGLQFRSVHVWENDHELQVVNLGPPPYAGSAYDVDQNEHQWVLPAFAGVELRASKAVALRFGLSHNVLSWGGGDRDGSILNANPSAPSTFRFTSHNAGASGSQTVTIAAGAGAKLGGFTLDAVTRLEFLYGSTYAMSGIPAQFAVGVSATYGFGAADAGAAR